MDRRLFEELVIKPHKISEAIKTSSDLNNYDYKSDNLSNKTRIHNSIKEQQDNTIQVYISYVREDYGESYDIYSITNTETEARTQFKEDIKTFISMMPDDTFTLNLNLYAVAPKTLAKLKILQDKIIDGLSDEDEAFLKDILEEPTKEVDGEDSMSIYDALAKMRLAQLGSNGYDFDDCYEEIMDNEEIFNTTLDAWLQERDLNSSTEKESIDPNTKVWIAQVIWADDKKIFAGSAERNSFGISADEIDDPNDNPAKKYTPAYDNAKGAFFASEKEALAACQDVFEERLDEMGIPVDESDLDYINVSENITFRAIQIPVTEIDEAYYESNKSNLLDVIKKL